MIEEHLKSKVVTDTYRLPCGYIYETEEGDFLLRNVKLREISGWEEDLLDRDEGSRESALVQELLANCLLELSDDEGHIVSSDTPEGKQLLRAVPGKLILSDLTTLFIRLRQLTVGDKVTFSVKCTDPTCGTLFTKIADLSQVGVIDVEGDPLERVRTLTTDRGNVIKWRMMTGQMQQKAEADALDIEAELQRRGGRKTTRANMLKTKKESKATAFLLNRIVSINDQEPTYQMVKDLAWSERQDIRDAFDQEGGMDTEILVRCACGNSFLTNISLTARNFFSRSVE